MAYILFSVPCKMKLLWILFVLSYASGFAQEKPQGIYAGLEKKYKGDSIERGRDTYSPKKYQWFDLTYIAFRGDSVFVEQMPVFVYRGDTIYSASEDGLVSYSGILSNDGTKLTAKLTLNDCDTCTMQMLNFTPARGASEDAGNLDIITDGDFRRKKDIREKYRYKTLVIQKIRKSKNIVINGNTYRPQYGGK